VAVMENFVRTFHAIERNHSLADYFECVFQFDHQKQNRCIAVREDSDLEH